MHIDYYYGSLRGNDVPILPNSGMFASFDPLALDQVGVDARLKTIRCRGANSSRTWQSRILLPFTTTLPTRSLKPRGTPAWKMQQKSA